MAGDDKMMDARGEIEIFVKEKIRALLEYPMDKYQDSNWLQAACLFEQVVLPCDFYFDESSLQLAQDIVKKAGQHNNRVVYRKIPGTYNVEIIGPNEVREGKVYEENWDSKIDKIKEWISNVKNQNFD